VTPARLQKILRRITLLLAAAGGIYLYSRFSLLVLPAEGCSPVVRYGPGTSLLLDQHPDEWSVRDVVIFEAEGGVVSLGEIERLNAEGAAWIVTDDPDCPAPSSVELGWIAEDRLAARVIFAASW